MNWDLWRSHGRMFAQWTYNLSYSDSHGSAAHELGVKLSFVET